MEEKKIYTCVDALAQIDTFIDFVMNEGEGMSIKDVTNIIDSVGRISDNVQKSDAFDEKIKEWILNDIRDLRLRMGYCGVKNIVYDLEKGLRGIKSNIVWYIENK